MTVNTNPSDLPSGAASDTRTAEDPRGGNRRRLVLTTLVSLALVVAIAAWFVLGRDRISTEDAYVSGNVVMVTARIGGVVTAIDADDTDAVRAGQSLVRLDDTDPRLALQQAEAHLAVAVRQVRARYAAADSTHAGLEMREVALDRARADLAHRRGLLASGAVSGEDVRHAEQAVRAADAALRMARQQWAGTRAAIDRTTLARNPDVRAAAAQVRDAYVALHRTNVPAPVSGMVTGRHVQLGQHIAPGMPLMAVVPLDQLWVDANFKESQLRNLRIGQPVTLTSDLYGRSVVFHGTVVGQEPGTGSAFSLLPAQNATGNWIKVVQRVPVRIALRTREIRRHPLQLGLSMRVTVSTRFRGGPRLDTAGTRLHRYSTDVYAHQLAHADALVASIIQANR